MNFFAVVGCILICSLPSLAAEESDLPTPAVLSKQVYGLEGEPCIIRLDTLVYTPIKGSILYDVENGGPGGQYNETLLWHPKTKDAGTGKRFRIGLYSGSSFRPLGMLEATFLFCDPEEVKVTGTVRWLAIGDSLTYPGHYITQVMERFRNRLPGVTLLSVGTEHPKENKALHHEGRGGWSWVRFLEAFPPKHKQKSPFVFGPNGADDFDFGRYLQEQLEGKSPEVITLFLGTNDVYGISADFSPENVKIILERAEKMVGKIRVASPNSVIGIIPPPPPSEQNGFGLNYGNGVTEWQYRRAMQYYIAGLLQTFDGRQDEQIYIVPGYLSFDPATAFPVASGRSQNALHPTAQGFMPISLSLTAWMVHLLSTQKLSPK